MEDPKAQQLADLIVIVKALEEKVGALGLESGATFKALLEPDPRDPTGGTMFARLQTILTEEARRDWLFAKARRWSGYVLAILGGLVAFRDDLASLLAWLVGRGPS